MPDRFPEKTVRFYFQGLFFPVIIIPDPVNLEPDDHEDAYKH